MDKEFLFEVLNSYYNHLSNTGKVTKKDQCKLLLLNFINDLLYSELGIYINEEDYREIDGFLYNLYGSSCLIPYPEFKGIKAKNDSKNIIISSPRVRVTEVTIRKTSDNSIRITS